MMRPAYEGLHSFTDSGEVGERFESGYKVIRYVPESVARKAAVLSLLLGVI